MAWSTRSIYIVFWPLLVIAVTQRARQQIFSNILAAGSGLLLGCAFQMGINWRYFGSPMYSDNWRNIAATVYGWQEMGEVHSLGQVIQAHGVQLATIWVKRMTIQLPEDLLHVVYWPFLLAVPGVVYGLRDASNRLLYVVWGLTTAFYLTVMMSVWRIELRYYLPVIPFLLISAGWMWEKLSADHKRLQWLGILAVAAISLAAATENVGEFVATQAPEYKDAGIFLHQNTAPDDVVLATQPQVFFYAERPGILFEQMKKPDNKSLLDFVQQQQIRWVVFDQRRGGWEYPELSWLLAVNVLSTENDWTPGFSTHEPSPLVVWEVKK